MTAFALLVVGLIVGSFLNVLSIRYKEGGRIFTKDTLVGRSACRKCGKNLAWYELLPIISFAIQLGKCRKCRAKLSWQYPLIEILCAGWTLLIPIFLFNFFHIRALGLSATQLWPFFLFVGAWTLVGYTLVLMSLIDLRLSIIPDQINVFLLFLGAVVVALKAMFASIFIHSGSFLGPYGSFLEILSNVWLASIAAAILAAMIFGAIILISRGQGMGMGDLKLIFPLGLVVGWPDVILVISLSFIIGSLISLPSLLMDKKKLKSAVPFGPFIALAVFATIIGGQVIAQWYFALI